MVKPITRKVLDAKLMTTDVNWTQELVNAAQRGEPRELSVIVMLVDKRKVSYFDALLLATKSGKLDAVRFLVGNFRNKFSVEHLSLASEEAKKEDHWRIENYLIGAIIKDFYDS